MYISWPTSHNFLLPLLRPPPPPLRTTNISSLSHSPLDAMGNCFGKQIDDTVVTPYPLFHPEPCQPASTPSLNEVRHTSSTTRLVTRPQSSRSRSQAYPDSRGKPSTFNQELMGGASINKINTVNQGYRHV
ncbi:hypothetical protein OH76DRAFT_1405875 [Lentinus brumalis]|uniref:Uncharacterized protein n=1 Tax=Lentinus brumalis TaxID=2498619 RepID=A0A371D4Q4_9APHY|nr:hypothetical protein OH76DRAFT_1405875 [Polyporus brumalis]